MDLTALDAELVARGFDFTTAARRLRFLNQAYRGICRLYDWPFLLTSTTGTAPITIADLNTVESVTDLANLNKLRPHDRRSITDVYPDLTITGTPTHYYFTSQTTIAVYPANTSLTLTVRYWKLPTALALAADTPLIPGDEFQFAIVEGASVPLHRERNDLDGMALAQAEYDRLVDLMRESLLDPQHDRADTISVDWRGFF